MFEKNKIMSMRVHANHLQTGRLNTFLVVRISLVVLVGPTKESKSVDSKSCDYLAQVPDLSPCVFTFLKYS